MTGILVGSGPKTNIDLTARNPASGRSQVRLFSFLTAQPLPIMWENGFVVAYGIRNPAGLTFVPSIFASPLASQTLLVVENSASIENVTGLTATFANDNPADEIESLTMLPSINNTTGPFFGFPDCATLWNGSADPVGVPQFKRVPRGTQFSLKLPDVSGTTPHLDPWCQDMSDNRPPAFSFQVRSTHI